MLRTNQCTNQDIPRSVFVFFVTSLLRPNGRQRAMIGTHALPPLRKLITVAVCLCFDLTFPKKVQG